MATTFISADPPPVSDPDPAIARSNDAFASSPDAAELGATNDPPINLRPRALLRDGLARSESAPDLGRAELGTSAAAQIRPPLTKSITVKSLLEPSRPIGKPPTWKTSALNIARYSWLNVLLVFIPISWAMHFSGQNATVVFCCSFVAIIPLAALLGLATEELALRVGDAMGGLLNATFGNTTELIIAILALVKGELRVVQSSMLGSILSNCLLVLGTAYMAGGLRFHEQGYQVRAAQLNINLLGIAVTAIVIPVAFHSAVTSGGRIALDETEASVLKLSRGIAIILLFVYAAYLIFQLWTHAYLYIPARRGPTDPPPPPVLAFIDGPQPPTEGGVFRLPSWGSSSGDSDEEDGIGMDEIRKTGSVGSGSSKGRKQRRREKKLGSARGRAKERERKEKKERKKGEKEREKEEKEEEKDVPKLSLKATGLLLLVVTVLTAFTAEWLVSSIEGLTATNAISTEFVALILLPLVGNVAEHVTAVTVATKGKIDLSMAVAVGSSIQIALFVIPLLILLGWIIGQPLTLFFDTFEAIVLFVSIVTVNWAIGDGRSNWLEGLTLAVIYVIIAVVFWYYPGADALAAL